MWSQEGTSLETAALAHGWDRLLWSPLSHTAYFLPAERMDVTHIFMCSFSHHSVYEYQVLFVTCFLSMLFLTLKIYFSCFKHIYIDKVFTWILSWNFISAQAFQFWLENMHASSWVSQAGAAPPTVDLNRKCLSRKNRELPWRRDASVCD